MISSIVGHYLVSRKAITDQELEHLLQEQQEIRVKLGLIAVAEGMMTQEEADEVNALQAVKDMRFGDIAVEKGYLTRKEVEALLGAQENSYLAFAQALENRHLMSIGQLEAYVADFLAENGFTSSDFEDMKSDDVDRILPLYLSEEGFRYLSVAGSALRTIMRCVNAEIYIEKAFLTRRREEDNCVMQCMNGEMNVVCSMAGKGSAFLPIASVFGREEFSEVNKKVLDAIGELLSCITGIYVDNLNRKGISAEISPLESYPEIKALTGDEMLVLPLHVMGERIDFVFAIGSEVGVEKQERM